jgi:hypothetical protein
LALTRSSGLSFLITQQAKASLGRTDLNAGDTSLASPPWMENAAVWIFWGENSKVHKVQKIKLDKS